MGGGSTIEKLSPEKKRLLDYLGKPFTTKIIDLENCVYLDMGDYDIEISGGENVMSKFNIYVWRTKGRFEIVDRYLKLKPDLQAIKNLLDNIRSRYFAIMQYEMEELFYGKN